MTLTLRDRDLVQAEPMPADPISLDGLFAWYGPGLSRRGVVLCGTLGYEQISAYRGWRRLAADLTAAGHPTVRFDYPGEGDSADPEMPGVESLLEAIRRCVRFLREEGGAEEIVLVGLRFGATLAALAAEEGDIDRLVLLAPFASGRAYLREMTMRTKTIDQLPDGRPFPQDPSAPVFGGFRPPAGLLAAIGRVDLTKVPLAPVKRALLLGPDPAGLAARLRDAGAEVAAAPFPGLAAFLSNALISEPPREVLAQVVAFVAEGAPDRLSRLAPRGAGSAASISTPAWTENVVRFADTVGVLCVPRAMAPGMPGLLFINSGVNPRSGYGRQTTDLARTLAGRGIRSLRIDLRGVGDGGDRPDAKPPLYTLDAVDEIAAAIDRLDEGNGVVVTGTCSGAYLGFHVLCRDERVRAGILVNLYCFDWDPATDLATALKPSFRSPASYASLLRQPDAWRRLLRGEVRAGAIVSRLASLAAARLGGMVRKALRPFPSATSVAGRIALIRKRGARLILVFSAGESGLGEVAAHLGRSPDAVARRLGHPLVILPETDHNLSTDGALDRLEAILAEVMTTAANPARASIQTQASVMG